MVGIQLMFTGLTGYLSYLIVIRALREETEGVIQAYIKPKNTLKGHSQWNQAL